MHISTRMLVPFNKVWWQIEMTVYLSLSSVTQFADNAMARHLARPFSRMLHWYNCVQLTMMKIACDFGILLFIVSKSSNSSKMQHSKRMSYQEATRPKFSSKQIGDSTLFIVSLYCYVLRRQARSSRDGVTVLSPRPRLWNEALTLHAH
ncbi:unnamed protein product [Arctia plantaginis]|uniref:Uncharacterized protein n=1 Tax=Arctia plantaginis TaxID=874455 RepID=A0A8S0YUH2_ARCPL|nr:unnamed protein product [Arctia plantaginis]